MIITPGPANQIYFLGCKKYILITLYVQNISFWAHSCFYCTVTPSKSFTFSAFVITFALAALATLAAFSALTSLRGVRRWLAVVGAVRRVLTRRLLKVHSSRAKALENKSNSHTFLDNC